MPLTTKAPLTHGKPPPEETGLLPHEMFSTTGQAEDCIQPSKEAKENN